MIFADYVFDIISNVTRFFILLELLRIEYPAVQAAIIASLIASSFSYLAINLIVRRFMYLAQRKNYSEKDNCQIVQQYLWLIRIENDSIYRSRYR